MDLSYWWLFPTAIVIASFAMTVGVGGPVFFSPIYILILQLPPPTAFGTALITQLFGFASGVYGYQRQNMIDYRMSSKLLITAIPAAIIGVLVSNQVNHNILNAIFGGWVVFSGIVLCLTAGRERENTEDSTPNKKLRMWCGLFLSALGGCMVGMTSTGMGNLLVPWMNVLEHVPIRKTVATCVFTIFITVSVSAVCYLFLTPVDYTILMFTIPGVLVGGQIGPWISNKLDSVKLKLFMSVVFILVGLIMLHAAFFK
ncbi:MAG: sulfite exporter TauE/SafE family protein [Desulfobacterales bacterium]|nr:sulfite exporter TauE/SafE family protein [Desulfobacterales bacterium]